MLDQLVTMIDGSSLQRGALYLLSQIRGFPPAIQTVHLLAISTIMGSVVVADLRLLGVMLTSQRASDLVRRLLRWTWLALPLLFVSGIPFVLARPQRYAMNPIFRIKFLLILPAVLVTLALHVATLRESDFWEASTGRRTMGKVVATISLLLWVSVVLAGRWIAYADYLIPAEE